MAFDRWTEVAGAADLDDVLLPGTMLQNGRYLVRSFLGSGGFGNAYVARDSLDRDVVLKECFVPELCLRSQGAVVPRAGTPAQNLARVMASFRQEAQTLSLLSHPGIVRTHGCFDENGTVYVVLDHIRGRDLQDLIDGDATLSPARIVAIARRLISALGHVHDRGFLHCHISPDNVCLRDAGEPVRIDFGSARRWVDGVAQPGAGFSMVKDGYSPHEFYIPNAPFRPASDIYALGATLHHAITGQPPQDGQTRRNALADGAPDPYAPLAGRVAGYPARFLASVDKALSTLASDRFRSADDWLAALDGQGAGTGALLPMPWPQQTAVPAG